MKSIFTSILLILSLLNINAQNPCKPYLILLQQTKSGQSCGVNTRTQCVIQNIATIESQPFDGMCVDIPASWSLMKSTTTLTYSDVYTNWLKPIDDAFVKFQHNFVLVFTDKPGDLFDDVAWNKVIQNFKVLAQAAKAANFKGIFYDNEEYGTPWQNYPDDYPGTTKTLKEFQDQARLRGKQVMEAMVSEFPEIIVMTLHGPYASEPKVPSYVTMTQIADASHQELLGPFFVGMVEGMGTKARIIDGGEVYQYRSVSDFQKSYDWRKTTIANSTTNCAFIPTSLRPEWGNKVEIGFGVYNLQWKTEYPMNAAIMKTTLVNALNRTDSYVWYYTEDDDWTIPGAMPQEWRDTVKNANNAIIRNCGSGNNSIIIDFEDRPVEETTLNGIYKNVDWGSNSWATYYDDRTTPGTKAVFINSTSTSAITKTFTLPENMMLVSLKISVLGNPSVKQVTISSPGNNNLVVSNMTNTPTKYLTNWTNNAQEITVTVTCNGSYGAASIDFDDIEIGDASIITPVLIPEKEKFQPTTIYPNPTSDILYFKNLPADATIKVFSADGRLKATYKTKEVVNGIDVSAWQKGVYIISVNNINNIVKEKVIIK